jgi:maltose alpha-D-glucosyltransferase/alpha-amylase
MTDRIRQSEGLPPDPFWYKSGVIYEVHVRAFYDTNADGAGDFLGLTEKLDYIKDLGVTAIWLLPFYPSPLKDDGYDISDYCAVHPLYGTLDDFKTFLREAHRKGLRVINELVLNHTSDQHPWFQRARRAPPGSAWRDFYVWSETGKEYPESRIIFKDVEISNWAWDPVAGAYYWHRFFAHQPDLNFDNPKVHEAILKTVDFWFELGVDGLRLDAVPYLYEREGTSCENLPETHGFLKKLRAHVEERFSDRMLLGEANQWPEDAVTYFGQGRGDECHMAFHFPLMPRLFMALRMEDRQPITDILEQTPAIPETCQWALFLRNHDELTLEMVTDEERDYMYRMYAHVPQARLNLGIRRRLAPLLNNDRKCIELLNALLFSLPGTPVLYYGDEIGLGENIFLGDRNGVRTPMQWSPDKNAGFSRANPQSLYLPIILDPGYHYEASNVEVQLANPHSLLWWMRRMLALRKRWRALGEGKCEFLPTENRRILCYLLRFQQETLLVVANLSRFTQPVELDLAAFNQLTPVELFGRTPFPEISEKPYFLSLGPHSFFWFSLEPKFAPTKPPSPAMPHAKPHALTVVHNWREVLAEHPRFNLKDVFSDFLEIQPWFAGKRKTIKSLAFKDIVPVPFSGGEEAVLTFLQVDYVEGDSEVYSLPLAFAREAEAEALRQRAPSRIIAEVTLSHTAQHGLLYDALGSAEFCAELLNLLWHRQSLTGQQGELGASRTSALRQLVGEGELPKPSLVPIEQSNSSVLYADKLILKLIRRLEPGANPEMEMTQFLNSVFFPHSPALAGAIEYTGSDGPPITLAVVNTFIPGSKNAWSFTLEILTAYYDRAVTWVAQKRVAPGLVFEPLKLLRQDIPAEVAEAVGNYLDFARLLGTRTAELHLALATDPENEAFAPEAYNPLHRRGLFQSMRSQAVQNLRLLKKRLKTLDAELQTPAQQVVDLESGILQRFRAVYERRCSARRLRIHGDCHLGQVLWTGSDFSFIDFEGDPSIPISERGIKRSPLRDVATMVCSFLWVGYTGLEQHRERGSLTPENLAGVETWLHYWNLWVSVAFLKAYHQAIAKSDILPANDEDFCVLTEAYLLNAMVREIGKELQGGAHWLNVPLQGILFLMSELSESPPPAAAPSESSEVLVKESAT